MLSLRDVVGQLTQNNSIFRTLKDQFALQQFWMSQFDSNITGQAQINRVEDGVLIFDVRSPVWTAQLKFYTQTILEKFQKHWPEIRNLRFQNMAAANAPTENERTSMVLTPVMIESLPDDPIERLRIKTKYLLELRLAAGWKVCKQCQAAFNNSYWSECLLCRHKMTAHKNQGLLQQIVEAPWSRTAEEGSDKTMLREKFRDQTNDQIKSLFWQYQKEPSLKLKKQMGSLLQQYASLKTGLSPQELNDKIISEAIGKTFYQRWLKISKQ